MTVKAAIDEQTPWHTERRWVIHKDGAQYDCALLYHGTEEVQVQVFQAGTSLADAHRCESRNAAVAKADELKAQYLRGGGFLIK